MEIEDFLESISESEYVYYDPDTGLFFSWNGLQVVTVWTTDEDDYENIDMFTIESGHDTDFVQEKIDGYLESIEE
ncbi:MAG TPA: hypothetical protein VJ944_03095 [Thermoplasmataceae archaeon]|nr:hypothetical protein [Thermoplasmataceae archaeon]